MEVEFAVTAPRSLEEKKRDINGLGLGLNLQRGEVVATMLNRRNHERKGSRSMDPVGKVRREGRRKVRFIFDIRGKGCAGAELGSGLVSMCSC